MKPVSDTKRFTALGDLFKLPCQKKHVFQKHKQSKWVVLGLLYSPDLRSFTVLTTWTLQLAMSKERLESAVHHLLHSHLLEWKMPSAHLKKWWINITTPWSFPSWIWKKNKTTAKSKPFLYQRHDYVHVTTAKTSIWGLGKRNCKAYWSKGRLEVTALPSLIRLAKGSRNLYQFFGLRLLSFSLQSCITWEGIMFPLTHGELCFML